MEIIPEFPPYKVMTTIKKGVSGGVVTSVGLFLMSCVHGLTQEQSQAGLVIVVAGLESVRSFLKKKFPRSFSWF
jgi:hypothetical protein